MIKTKLTISEIINLESELNGVSNQQTGEVLFKGLLNHKLPLLVKYRLTEFADKLVKIKKNTFKLQQDLYKELGEQVKDKPDIYEVKRKIKIKKEDSDEEIEIDNPNLKKLNEEIKSLSESEKELEHYPFRITDFAIETEETFPIFLSKIVREEEPVEAEK